MSTSDGVDEEDVVEGDDSGAADDDAGVGVDAICTALVGDDADENAGAAGAAIGSGRTRSERRIAPSELKL